MRIGDGPNLHLLGLRVPHIRGSTALKAIRACCEAFAAVAGGRPR